MHVAPCNANTVLHGFCGAGSLWRPGGVGHPPINPSVPPVVDVLTELFDGAGVEVGPCLQARDAQAAIAGDPDAWALLI